ncbi:pentatricopeptide repeat-containing protein, putative [Ricinus communis]|uniref:Pentatricopeptide repeat-containing protein, putative n=1 Tax=Ricinus communis TaxID=3988 RepID=B9ST45_RICCO|nr:pentatricopeptide repeat-containing protein, putative [Ricinus communis]
MPSLFRVSVAFSRSRKASKRPILCNLKLLSFSINYSTVTPRISLPDGHHSASSEVARFNWHITKLCREGKINEARQVFDRMLERDVITWTTVITGYIKCRLIVEARRLFDRADAMKNVVTWTAMVSGYMRLNQVLEAERVDEARRLFDEMPKRDVISWTAMVAGLARNGRIDEARKIFDKMPERNVVSWNAMITGYAKNMRLVEAFELFERMPERDLPSWNTMITGFIQNKELKLARKLLDEMPEKNVVSWTTMITGYVQEGESEAALNIFMEMIRDGGVMPNEGTFVNVLGACSDLAGLGEGQQVHQMISKTVYQDMPFVVSALINMYSKCGELDMARKMFDNRTTSQRDLVSWNCMVAAYAHHGCGKEAINLFNEMRALGFEPDDISYVGLLSACSHAGLVKEGLSYFQELVKDKSIQVERKRILIQPGLSNNQVESYCNQFLQEKRDYAC